MKRYRIVLIFFLYLTIAGSIAACGAGSKDGDVEDAVAYSRSEDIFTGAEQAFQDVLEADGELKDAYAAAADYLLLQREVDAVQFRQDKTDTSAFIARLKNGLRYSIAFRNIDSTQSAKPEASQQSIHGSKVVSKIQGRNTGLPTSKNVLLIDSFFDTFEECKTQGCPAISDIQEVKKLLEKYDYNVTLKTQTSIDDFRNINNYDVVYIAAHGIYYEEDGISHFAIPVDLARDDDLEESGAVPYHQILVTAYFTRGIGGVKKVKSRHYAVNELFFAQNTGAFRDDSIVYVDTCNSTARINDFTAPPLVGVLSSFNLKNYLGWDDSVNSPSAVKVANYVFSHMLGDTPASMQGIEEKKPPIRPNGLHAVMLGLEQKNWIIDKTYANAKFEHMDLNQGSREALMRPAIDGITLDVDIDNEEQTLSLTGAFGDRTGSVEVCDSVDQDAENCSTLSVSEWNDDEIIVDLGSDCSSNCTGGVRVVVGEHKSNVQPLTEWKGQIKIEGQYSSIGPTVNLTVDANFRGEIVNERATAEGDPEGPFSQAAAMLGLDSKATYKFSGQFEDANYTYSYTGNGSLTPVSVGKQGFFGAVTLKPDEGQAVFAISVIAEANMTRTMKSPPFTPEQQMLPIGVVMYHEGSMDKYGTISADSVMLGSLSASYEMITPTNAPTDETPR